MMMSSAWGKSSCILPSWHCLLVAFVLTPTPTPFLVLLRRDVSVQGVVKLFEDPNLEDKVGSFSQTLTFVRARNTNGSSHSSKAGSGKASGRKLNGSSSGYGDYILRAQVQGSVVFDDGSQVSYGGDSTFEDIPRDENEVPVSGGTGRFPLAAGVAKFGEYSSNDYYYSSDSSYSYDDSKYAIQLCLV